MFWLIHQSDEHHSNMYYDLCIFNTGQWRNEGSRHHTGQPSRGMKDIPSYQKKKKRYNIRQEKVLDNQVPFRIIVSSKSGSLEDAERDKATEAE